MTIFREKIHQETFGGYLLFTCAILGLIIANSPLAGFYNQLLHTNLHLVLGKLHLGKPIILWINDGLMSIFFLVVGLEIKREITKGVLRDRASLSLPLITATAGLVVPALIYWYFNAGMSIAMKGWAIPTATDIAFSLGILSLLGDRIAPELKILLTAIAIIDDIGAILIIALFYTTSLSYTSLLFSIVAMLVLLLLNRNHVTSLVPYLFVGIILWFSVLQSGVHATLAGIVLAFAIPLDSPNQSDYSPLISLEHSLIPWVTFGVLPLFAFANTGFSIFGLTINSLSHPIPLGIACGLFFGKQIGIFGSCWLSIKLKLAKLPENLSYQDIYGLSLLCGVGFTMSLFIGGLAFRNHTQMYTSLVRLGVLFGSSVSGVLGYLFLYTNRRK